MWMSLFSTILVLLIAFYQGVQGLFSGWIMAVLSILSAGVAFSVAEPLASWSSQWVSPEYALAAAFMVVFLLCLAGTRVAADWVIAGGMRFPMWVDRIGGGLCGLVAGLVIVGMLCMGVQMLPFGADVAGFARVAVDESGAVVRRALWLRPDSFTAGLMGVLSEGSLSGSTKLGALHPNWLAELQWNRSGVQKESRHAVGAGSLRVEAAWDAAGPVVDAEGGEAVSPAVGRKFVVVRVSLERGAVDSDGKHRFTPMQWRLVGPVGRSWEQMWLRGMSDPDNPAKLVALRADEPVVLSAEAAQQLDLVFEVPESKEFALAFVEYKRGAREALGKGVWQDEALAPIKRAGAAVPAPGGEETGEGQRPQPEPGPRASRSQEGPRGRVSGRYAIPEESRFGDEMPVPLPAGQVSARDAVVSGDRFAEGHVVVDLSAAGSEGQAKTIARFAVPSEMRLLQLATEPLFAKSTLGRARQFAVKTLRQYRVQDDQGGMYFPIGEYRTADLGGQQMLELQYWPNAEMPERALRDALRIRERDLEAGGQLTYLFLVPPGRRITQFTTGTTRMDLTTLNLVAPE